MIVLRVARLVREHEEEAEAEDADVRHFARSTWLSRARPPSLLKSTAEGSEPSFANKVYEKKETQYDMGS